MTGLARLQKTVSRCDIPANQAISSGMPPLGKFTAQTFLTEEFTQGLPARLPFVTVKFFLIQFYNPFLNSHITTNGLKLGETQRW